MIYIDLLNERAFHSLSDMMGFLGISDTKELKEHPYAAFLAYYDESNRQLSRLAELNLDEHLRMGRFSKGLKAFLEHPSDEVTNLPIFSGLKPIVKEAFERFDLRIIEGMFTYASKGSCDTRYFEELFSRINNVECRDDLFSYVFQVEGGVSLI